MPEDKPTYLAPGSYVTKVAETNDGEPIYEAGERSKKYESGEQVPLSYAKSVLGAVNFRNRTMGMLETAKDQQAQRKEQGLDPDEDLPENYQEAQQIISDFNSLTDELNDAQEAENEERIEEIEQEIDQLRGKLGS